MQTFGEKIRALRKKKGLTQGDLAEKVGMSVSYISQIERGAIGFSFEAAKSIAEALDTSLPVLLQPEIPIELAEEVHQFLLAFSQLSPERREIAYKAILAMSDGGKKEGE